MNFQRFGPTGLFQHIMLELLLRQRLTSKTVQRPQLVHGVKENRRPSSTFTIQRHTRHTPNESQKLLNDLLLLRISPEIVHLKQNHTSSTEHLTRHINSFPVNPTTSCSAGKLQMTTSKCLSGLSFVCGHSGSVFILRDTSSTHSYWSTESCISPEEDFESSDRAQRKH